VALLPGLHDIESAAIAPPDSWILDTVALSENPLPKAYPTNLNVIARLNWGYGSTGTLPVPDQYQMFAERVAQYVNGCSGCRRWQIGNETNLRREWPDLIPIFPWHYTAAYRLCRNAIHALPGHQSDEVLIAGSGPWNDELKYDSNKDGDWITYFADVVDLCAGELDGFALHAYTHGYDPQLVTSTARMDHPFENRYYNFRTYQDYCRAIPEELRHLPAYICEANGDGPWQATGLIPAMLQEIDTWNRSGPQKIYTVIFYRYTTADEKARFAMVNKPDVMAEYHAAAPHYHSPEMGGWEPPRPIPPDPLPPIPAPEPEREIDPVLLERGVRFDYCEPPPGTWFWKIVKAEHLNKQEAIAVGPDHHILGTVLRDGVQKGGVPYEITWPSGKTTIYSKEDDPNASYNYDYGMSASLNEFSIVCIDGAPSDKASGIGMGDHGNPAEHTSTWIEWVYTMAGHPAMLTHPEYVTPLLGANLRDAPGQHGAILTGVPYRQTVIVSGVTDIQSDGYAWCEASYGGYQGYIRSDLLSLIEPPVIVEPPPLLGDLVHPLAGSIKTQHWGENGEQYLIWKLWGHDGCDFGGKAIGTPIVAMAAGLVSYVGYDHTGYGYHVEIMHDALEASTVYCHAQDIDVQVGQPVSAGDTVATVGSSGNSSGPHLHLEVRLIKAEGGYRDGTPMPRGRVDPETWAILHGLKL
jgi:hypothetical protein